MVRKSGCNSPTLRKHDIHINTDMGPDIRKEVARAHKSQAVRTQVNWKIVRKSERKSSSYLVHEAHAVLGSLNELAVVAPSESLGSGHAYVAAGVEGARTVDAVLWEAAFI